MLLAAFLGAAAAQNSSPTTLPQASAQAQEKQTDGSQRAFGVIPQFSVTSQLNATPLTTGQKFRLFERSSFDPFNFAAAGLQAGLSQATDEFPQYGQGAEGYAKRYGASFADQVSSSFFSNFFYPMLLKEDPRYFRLGRGTVKRRVVYSLEQEFVAYKDNGGKTFAFENVLGAFTSGNALQRILPKRRSRICTDGKPLDHFGLVRKRGWII